MTTTYHTVCQTIGWQPQHRPIRVTRSTRSLVWVTGSDALSAREWWVLLSFNGFRLRDGRTLRVTQVPVKGLAALSRWSDS